MTTTSFKHFIPAAWTTRSSGMPTTCAWRGFTCIVTRLKKHCGEYVQGSNDSPRIATCPIFTMKRSQLPGCTYWPLIASRHSRSSSRRMNRGSAKICSFVSGLLNCLIPGKQEKHGRRPIVRAYRLWSEARKTSHPAGPAIDDDRQGNYHREWMTRITGQSCRPRRPNVC